jgi:eukaryotic-like serine/threonine-protein kinase
VRGAHGPVWSRDGRTVLFGSNRFDGLDLFTMPADGSGTESLLLRDQIQHRSVDWSHDGRLVLYEIGPEGQNDLWIVPVSAPHLRSAFLDSRANEIQGQFSPDGKWVAYTSNESVFHEFYVRRFPERDAKWRVSIGGGAKPRWRGDGRDLLFNTGIRGMFVDRRNHYVVTQDGERFLINQMGEDDNTAPITVVANWR